MKRLIAAVGLIAFVACTCFVSARYVIAICEKSEKMLAEAETAILNGDAQAAKTEAQEAADYWKEKRHFLFVFVNRGEVDEITDRMESLPDTADLPGFRAWIHSVRYHLDRMTKDQTLHPEHFI